MEWSSFAARRREPMEADEWSLAAVVGVLYVVVTAALMVVIT